MKKAFFIASTLALFCVAWLVPPVLVRWQVEKGFENALSRLHEETQELQKALDERGRALDRAHESLQRLNEAPWRNAAPPFDSRPHLYIQRGDQSEHAPNCPTCASDLRQPKNTHQPNGQNQRD